MYGKKEKKKIDIDECAAKKLSQKSMSAKELSDYLSKREYEKDEIKRVIDSLKEFGYLNDSVFASEFFIYELGRGRSKKKVIYELRQKGVSEEDIEKGFDGYFEEYGEPDEHAMAVKEAGKVISAAGEITDENREKIKGRIARRLFTRGFSQSLIYEVLGEVMD